MAKPKRLRGRPSLPLASDPERLFLALLSAHIEIAKKTRVSEGRVLETFAAARYGEPVENLTDLVKLALTSPDCGPRERQKLAAIERRGADGLVGLDKWRRGRKGSEWHSKNAFRPFAEGWRRKLNLIRAKPPTDADWMWLDQMTAAWRVCLTGEIELARAAEILALLAGAKGYFDEIMRPLLEERAEERKSGLKVSEGSPELLRNLIRETLREIWLI